MTADPELTAEQQRLPVGTPVTYWPGIREAQGRESVTRTDVWRMPSGQLVVAVAGYPGGVALTHISTHTPRTDALAGLRVALADAHRVSLEATTDEARDLMAAAKTVLDLHLGDLPAAHPAEPAPVVTDEAVAKGAWVIAEGNSRAWLTYSDETRASIARSWEPTARAALEAAAPLLGPRPLLDQLPDR